MDDLKILIEIGAILVAVVVVVVNIRATTENLKGSIVDLKKTMDKFDEALQKIVDRQNQQDIQLTRLDRNQELWDNVLLSIQQRLNRLEDTKIRGNQDEQPPPHR